MELLKVTKKEFIENIKTSKNIIKDYLGKNFKSILEEAKEEDLNLDILSDKKSYKQVEKIQSNALKIGGSWLYFNDFKNVYKMNIANKIAYVVDFEISACLYIIID